MSQLKRQYHYLYKICMDKRNINNLLTTLSEHFRIDKNLARKCVQIIEIVTRRNIPKVNVLLEDKDDYAECRKLLNRKCLTTLVETIRKSKPELEIRNSRRGKHRGRSDKLDRDLDVFGPQENHIMDRPKAFFRNGKNRDYDDESGSESEDEDETYNQNMLARDDSYGNYAPAYSNNLISNFSVRKKHRRFSDTDHGRYKSHRDYRDIDDDETETDDWKKRLERMSVERGYGATGNTNRPPTPDFSDDGSGSREAKKKRKMKELMQKMKKLQRGDEDGDADDDDSDSFNGSSLDDKYSNLAFQAGGSIDGIDMFTLATQGASASKGRGKSNTDLSSNPYLSILGAGAPAHTQNNKQSDLDLGLIEALTKMGLGTGMDTMSFNNDFSGSKSQSDKSRRLQRDHEEKLQERLQLDRELGITSTNYNGGGW